MIGNLANKLVGASKPTLNSQESRAVVTLFLILAFCFNSLPPSFTYGGALSVGNDGSLTNQLFWIGILLLSFTVIINSPNSARGTYIKAFPLLMFCLLLIISSLWSLAPAISFRRSILETIIIGCLLINVASLQKAEQVFIILYRVAAITLLFEIVMLFRANGFDEVGLFRGIHTQKNVLGLVAAISIITGLWIRKSGFLKSTHWNSIYLLTWFGLLVISQSKTSLSLTLIAPIVAFFLRKLGRRVGLTLLIIFVIAYSIYAVAFIAGVDVPRVIGGWIHQIGFTGRDDIWQFLIGQYLERPWLGYGYGGFWDIGMASPNVRFGTGFIPMINQAHNGYLDLLLSVGVVGFLAYLFVFTVFLFNYSAAENQSQKKLLFLILTYISFSFLHNFTETSLLRGYALVWIVQVLCMTVIYRMAQEAQSEK